jgi:hypothetical protein
METVRDFLVDFQPKGNKISEDEAQFGAMMMTNKHRDATERRRNVVVKVNNERAQNYNEKE